MHIMHVIDSLSMGGAERMLVDIANATSADGHRVSVCITRDGRELAGELRPEIALWVLKRRSRIDFAAMRRFASIVRRENVSLLHVHGRSTFSFAAAVRTLGLTRTPILLHDHYGQIEVDTAVPLWFKIWGRRLVDRFVGVYAKVTDWAVSAGVPRSRCRTIGNSINLRRVQGAQPLDFQKEFGVASGEQIGLVVAGIRAEKGIDTLLEALAKLPDRHHVKVVIAGGARDTAYADQARARCGILGLSDKIVFAGERADVPSLIKGAQFGLSPSFSESGPLVLIEYMAGGLPFVATRVGDIANRAELAGASEFVPASDAGALAAALGRLLSLSHTELHERTELGKRVAGNHFRIEDTMSRWYESYRDCLSSSPS